MKKVLLLHLFYLAYVLLDGVRFRLQHNSLEFLLTNLSSVVFY